MKEYILEFLLIATVISGLVLFFLIDKQKKKMEFAMRDLLENMPGGMFEFRLDENFTIISANERFFNIVGYTKQTLVDELGDSLSKMVFISDIDDFKFEVSKQAQKDKNINMSARMIKRDGTLVWVSFRGRVYKKNNESFVRGVAIDITNSKQHASGMFDHIFDSIEVGIFAVSSEDYKIKNLNPYAYRVMSLDRTKNLEVVLDDVIHKDDISDFKLAMKKGIEENKNIKVIHRFKGNNKIWVETILNNNAHIGAAYVLVTFIDITHSKKLEQMVIKKQKEINKFYDYSCANIIVVDAIKNFDIVKIENCSNIVLENKSNMNLFSDLVYEKDFDIVKNILRTVISDGIYRGFRFRIYKDDKEITYISGTAELTKKTTKEVSITFIFFLDN